MLEDGKGLVVKLSGRFRLTTETGEEIPLTGTRAQAIFALLATEMDLGRTRAWIQDKLWSDRDQEHGASSLRTELLKIRKTLGTRRDILVANRQTVSLDCARTVVIDDDSAEFLEGLDGKGIREFESWLAIERQHRDDRRSAAASLPAPSVTPKRENNGLRSVSILLDFPEDPQLELIGSAFADAVLRTLRENFGITARRQAVEPSEPGAITVSIRAFADEGERFGIAVWVDEAERRGTVWSAVRPDLHATLDPTGSIELSALVTQLCEAVGDALSGHVVNVPFDRDANLLANLAVRKLFTIEKADVETADELLNQAIEIEPRGVFYAWRAQLLTIQFVEQFERDTDCLREKSREFCQHALADDPTNSSVLCAVANARMILDQDYPAGSELAQCSVRANPSNPLAWWALSNAHLHDGDYKAGYAAALKAQQLADHTRLKFWGDFQRSLAAAIIGNLDEAMRFGVSSNALAPNFRPALRYLLVLNANAGNIDRARRNVTDLSRREPEFSVDRLVNDPSYPAKFVHKAKLMRSDRILELA